MDINELRKEDMQEVVDFYYHIKDYGHIFHLDPSLLDEPFNKIKEGMRKVRELMEESYDM